MRKTVFLITAASLVLILFALATCKVDMGLGDPVDIVAPIISILDPTQNKSYEEDVAISVGSSIDLSGTWWDNVGIVSLSIQVIDIREGQKVYDDLRFDYTIKDDGTWSGVLYLPDDIEGGQVKEYNIKVTARDKAGNRGVDQVTIMFDLVAPWVELPHILRYPEANYRQELARKTAQTAGFYDSTYYGRLIDLQHIDDPYCYRRIRWDNIDEFQNESFTIKLEISSSFSGVAATRLWILDAEGNKLPIAELNREEWRADEWGLIPDSDSSVTRPTWYISAELLEALNPHYHSGPHLISFEVTSWNGAAWIGGWESGYPNESTEFSARREPLTGTCWYPESDIPHIYISADENGIGQAAIVDGEPLLLDVYDDDLLDEIYAVLLEKEEYDVFREKWDFYSENPIDDMKLAEAFHQAILTDTALRNDIIDNLCEGTNLLTGTEIRRNNIEVRPKASEGKEYRLIAMARDTKSKRPINTGNDSVWVVYPLLVVQVINPTSPLIIVEKPVRQNVFPELPDGRTFTLSGYTLGVIETRYVRIAWIPEASGKSTTDANQALESLRGKDRLDNNPEIVGDIRIWEIYPGHGLGPRTDYPLNGINYARNTFTIDFDIVNDFKVPELYPGDPEYQIYPENDNKRFYIQAVSQQPEYRPFTLGAYKDSPVITVVNPTRDYMIHNYEDYDIELEMKVISGGIALDLEKSRISDVSFVGQTMTEYEVFTGPIHNWGDGRYTRRVDEASARNGGEPYYFSEGMSRVYYFEATNILGKKANPVTRNVIMSLVPTLLYITSSNGVGTYGAGENLRFEAVFSMPVRVKRGTGPAPQLKLYLDNPPVETPNRYILADWVETKEDTTVTTVLFEYKVEEGKQTDTLYSVDDSFVLDADSGWDLIVVKDEDDGGNEYTGSAVTTMARNGTHLQNMKKIGIDGIRPQITRVEFVQNTPLYGDIHPGASYFNEGKTITMKLIANKPLRVSGLPTAMLGVGATQSYNASFSSITDNNTTMNFTWEVPGTPKMAVSQARWGQTGEGSNTWITKPSGADITDNYGNPLDLVNVPGGATLSGGTGDNGKRAYIITVLPETPTFTLYKEGEGAATPDDPVTSNSEIRIEMERVDNTVFMYSTKGGNDPQLVTGTSDTIEDENKDYRFNATDASVNPYEPSNCQITGWREDYAGNRSANADARNIIINSRAPELIDITCSEPDGIYCYESKLQFNLNFSGVVEGKSGASALLTLAGTESGWADTVTTSDFKIINDGRTVVLTVSVPANKRMRNIHATAVEFTNFVDEYGNSLPSYKGTEAEDEGKPRPITALKNLDRPGIEIDSVGPKLVAIECVPRADEIGTTTAWVIGMDRKITLKFDKEITPQTGKYIVIRPSGTWGVPPELSVEDFDNLYNAPFYVNDMTKSFNSDTITDRTEFQKRLKWLKPNGLPEQAVNLPDQYFLLDDSKANGTTKAAMIAERNKYNYYKYTTRGVVRGGTDIIVPDTKPKWVLAFRHDIYQGVDELREVFNAARWKWQYVLSTTSEKVDDFTVTITLPQTLDNGRIWEVVMDEGAFRDKAGNESLPIVPYASDSSEQTYRFWSDGVAQPFIRVERYSQGDHYHGVFDASINAYDGYGSNNRPKIDTRVRIDCETPGASISYRVVQSSYTMAAAGTATSSQVFSTTTLNTAAGFFDHSNATFPAGSEGNAGYGNNTIGNSASYLTPPNVAWSSIDTIGTTNPYTVDGARATANNAVFPVPDYDAYSDTGAGGFFFYAGAAYGSGTLNARDANGDNDSKLYSGRRDYVVAQAVKTAINTGPYTGPNLGTSSLDREGVYKTTVIHRNPAGALNGSSNGTEFLLIQGFDKPVNTTLAGFPLNDNTVSFTGTYPGTTDVQQSRKQRLNYFARQAWRVNTAAVPTNSTDARSNNNYIWVSWDIVTNWYHKAKANGYYPDSFEGRIGNTIGPLRNVLETMVPLDRGGDNSDSILVAYGAVTYRYEQRFDFLYTNKDPGNNSGGLPGPKSGTP